MAKNLVVLCDGTGNRLKPGPGGTALGTNVVRLKMLLEHNDPARQRVFYDIGVGTEGSSTAMTGVGRWTTKLLGKAFGRGIKKNVVQAYTFLMNNYEPGDRIYLIGFSRGAYTVRALAGMLRFSGLLPKGSENLISQALKYFWKRKQKDPDDFNFSDKWSEALSRSDFNKKAPDAIAFVGAFDTVKAVGWITRRLVLAWTRQLPNVATVRHAVSIDERRSQYKANLVAESALRDTSRDVQQVWFAGVHSDVGGTFADDSRLADIALSWMAHEAKDCGLAFDKAMLDALDDSINDGHANGKLHEMSKLWIVLGRRQRPIEPATAHIHQSVKIRMENGEYDPPLPQGHVFVDETWPQRPQLPI